MSSERIPTASVSPLAESGQRECPGSRIAPTQFRILDLFTAVTLAAVAFAILVPLLSRFSAQYLLTGVAAIGVQLVSATATFISLAVRRRRMLQRTGERFGVAYSGEVVWRHWPIVRCCLLIFGAGLLQFAISLVFVFVMRYQLSFKLFAPILLLYSLQLGYFFGAFISQLHWRSYPGFIEFYENGVTLDGRTLTPWRRVCVRESSIDPNRIVLVSDATNVPNSRSTHIAYVSKALRKQLFEFAAHQGG